MDRNAPASVAVARWTSSLPPQITDDLWKWTANGVVDIGGGGGTLNDHRATSGAAAAVAAAVRLFQPEVVHGTTTANSVVAAASGLNVVTMLLGVDDVVTGYGRSNSTASSNNNNNSNDSFPPSSSFEDDLLLLEDVRFGVPLNGFVSPLLILLTIVTNCFVCVVLVKPHMRTATNALLVSIAGSDMLTGVWPLPCYIFFYTLGHHVDWVPYDWCFVYFCLTEYLPTIFHTVLRRALIVYGKKNPTERKPRVTIL